MVSVYYRINLYDKYIKSIMCRDQQYFITTTAHTQFYYNLYKNDCLNKKYYQYRNMLSINE